MTVRKKNKLVHGVGINDADYVTDIRETISYVDGKYKQKRVRMCPFYRTWVSMLWRCYSSKCHAKHPTYVGCSVVPEWHRFSTFKMWMGQQPWQHNQLDKDILCPGNKIYGPNTCVFVSRQVNNFVVEKTATRGEWPIGVCWHKPGKKFLATCHNPHTKKQEHLGLFTCPKEAHQAWLKRKRELAHQLAALQTDPRVAKALIDRYDVDEYVPLHT